MIKAHLSFEEKPASLILWMRLLEWILVLLCFV